MVKVVNNMNNEKKFCTISVNLYLEMKKEISDLQVRLAKEIDKRLLSEARINDLESQNAKLSRIIDAIM